VLRWFALDGGQRNKTGTGPCPLALYCPMMNAPLQGRYFHAEKLQADGAEKPGDAAQ
jgi:hypothetical protein